MVNGMLSQGDTFAEGYNEPLTELLLGGWSWQASDFRLWRLHWVSTDSAFRHETVPRRPLGLCRFIGDRNADEQNLDVVPFAQRRLRELLDQRGKLEGPLDMEPFEVLVELIREQRFRSVGGPPQLAKVYPHMNTQFFAVLWPDAHGKVTYGGRDLLPYEEFGVPQIDPDRPHIHSRTTLDAERARRHARDSEVLLGLIETAGRATSHELAEWAAVEGLSFTRDEVTQWAREAANSGTLKQLDAVTFAWPEGVPEAVDTGE